MSTIQSNNTQSGNTMTSNNTQTGNAMQSSIIPQIWDLQSSIVKTLSFRIGDTDKAYDIGTNAIVKAVENISKFDPNKSNLKTWVSSIAWRLFLDSHKSYHNKNVSSGYDAQTFDTMAGSYEVDTTEKVEVSEDDFWGLVQDVLNEKQYGCTVRRFRDDMSYAEIAEDMRIPIGSVMSALSGAKNKLKSNPTFSKVFGK